MAIEATTKRTQSTNRNARSPKPEERLSDKELEELFEPCWLFQETVSKKLNGKALANDINTLLKKIKNGEWDQATPIADQAMDVMVRQTTDVAKAAFEAGFTLGHGGKGKGQGHRDELPRKYSDIPTLEEWLVRDIKDHGFKGSRVQRILKVILDMGAKGEFLKDGYKSVVFNGTGSMVSVESDRKLYRAATFEVTGNKWVTTHCGVYAGKVRRATENMKGRGAEFWRSARVGACVYRIDRRPTSCGLGMSPRPGAPTEEWEAWEKMVFYWQHYLARDMDVMMETRSVSPSSSKGMERRKEERK